MIGIGNIQQFGGGGGGVASAVAFPDVTGNPLDNTALQPYLSSVTNLENNEFKYLYFEAISGTSGVITKPQNSQILLGEIEGLNALVETIQSGRPTGNSPQTSGGSPVVVTSFDANGNYVLSGVPDAYPVAILYVFKTKGKEVQYVALNNVIADEQVGVMIGAGASNDGKSGEVPKPVLGEQNKVLAGNGIWRTIIDLLGYTPQNQQGRTNGIPIASGQIGQIIETITPEFTIVSSGATETLTTIILPIGSWAISANFIFICDTGTIGTQACGIYTSNSSISYNKGTVVSRVPSSAHSLYGNQLDSGIKYFNVAVPTTLFLQVYAEKTGTVRALAYISMQRIG